MQPDEDKKVKPQHLSQTQRYAIGVAVFLFGVGAWTYKKHGETLGPWAPQPLGAATVEHPHTDIGNVHADLGQGPESLEDALSTLEAGDDWASHGARLPESSLELPAAAVGKARKAKQAREPVVKEARAPKTKAKEKRSKRKAVDDDAVKAALADLEAPATGKGKKGKASAADRERAQAILRESLEKMQSEPDAEEDTGLLGGDLKERLEALVQDEEERDRDPDIVKAKAIIKDAIKKMDAPKSGKGKASKAEEEELEEGAEGDTSHQEFAKRLQEEAAMKHAHDMDTVRTDFKSEFGSDSRRLLCSGCKLVAARLDSELSNHDVHEAESPAHMIASKRRAIDATCLSFRHLHVTNGEGGPRFEAREAVEGEAQDVEEKLGQKLCTALLEESKFEVLSRLIRRKVPSASLFGNAEPVSNNWERLICAQRARVCKRNEVREDDDEEEL